MVPVDLTFSMWIISIAIELPTADYFQVKATRLFDAYTVKITVNYLYCHHNTFEANKK